MAGNAIQLAAAYVRIVPSMQGVGKAIVSAFDGASGKAGTMGGKAAGSGFADGLRAKMGAVIGAASAITSKAMDTIGSSISSAVSRADQMNNFPKVMKNLGYSSEDAAKSIKKISESLDGLPTTSSAMTGMVQQLAPLTSNLDEATTISLAFNNAMLAGGASTIEQENALAQYTQMLSAGTVDMAAWRSIQAAMPGQLNQVAEAMMGAGHNANDLYEAMKKGTYSFDDFNKTIVDLNQNGFGQYASFAKQAKDATQGIGTAIENVRNRVAKAVQKIIEAFGVETIAGAINTFSSQFGKIGDAAAGMVTATKGQFSMLWARVKDLGAINALKSAWDGLVSKLSGTDWASLLPAGVWGQLRDAAASALADVMERVAQLIGWLSSGIQWMTGFARSFANTGTFQAWIDVFGVVLDVVHSATDAFGSVIGAVARMTGDSVGAQSFGQTVGDAFKTIAECIKPALQALDNILQWFGANPGVIIAALGALGTAFAGIKGYQALNSGLQTLTGVMQSVTAGARGVSNGIMLMMDLGGPVATIKQMASNMGLVQSAQAAWSAATKAATAVQGAFNAVLAANPVGAVVIAVTALITALVLFFTKTELGRQIWASFISWLQQAWQSVSTFFTGLWDGIVQVFQDAVQSVQSAWGSVTSFFAGLWDGIVSGVQSAWNGVTGFFADLWNGISTGVRTAWTAIAGIFTSVSQMIQNAMATVWTVIGAIILAPIKLIQSGINTVFTWVLDFISGQMDSTSGVMQSAWMGIYGFVRSIWTLISAVVSTFVNAVRTVIVTILDLIKGDWQGAWDTVSSFFRTTWDGIVSFFTPVIEGVKTTIGNALNAISTWWSSVWTAISTFFSNIWDAIVSAVTQKVNEVGNVITSVCSAVSSWWSSVWNGISGFLSSVWNGMVNAVSNRINAVRDTVNGVLNAIRGVWNSVWNGISGFLSSVWNGMVNAVGGAVGRIGGQVGRIWGVVTGALSGAGGWLRKTGKDLIQGLINGIGDMFGWVRDKICSLGDNILGWARGVLGIGSPSKIFAQYGRWLDEGLAIGIDDAASRVGKAMDDMTGMVVGKGLDFGVEARLNATDMPGLDVTAMRPYEPPQDATGKPDGSTTIYQTINNPVAQPWPIRSADDSDHRFQDV